jgi:hypothetical protein
MGGEVMGLLICCRLVAVGWTSLTSGPAATRSLSAHNFSLAHFGPILLWVLPPRSTAFTFVFGSASSILTTPVYHLKIWTLLTFRLDEFSHLIIYGTLPPAFLIPTRLCNA